jgi:hypothetical protein
VPCAPAIAAGISSKRSEHLAKGESSAAAAAAAEPTGVHTSRPRATAAAYAKTPLLRYRNVQQHGLSIKERGPKPKRGPNQLKMR